MPRAKKKKEAESDDAFTVMFLSLSIILLALFILLNSIAELESDRVERALRSIQASHAGLGIFGEGVGLDKDSKSPGGSKPSVIVMDKIHELIQQSLVKWGSGKEWVETYEDERKLVISMQEAVAFSEGSNSMHPRLFPMLDKLGDLIQQVGIPLTIQGHSDSTGSSSHPELNWVLSEQRALEVARYLTEGVGLPDELVEAEAFSDSRPIASNATTEGRSKNRRVDLVFYKRDLNRLRFE